MKRIKRPVALLLSLMMPLFVFFGCSKGSRLVYDESAQASSGVVKAKEMRNFICISQGKEFDFSSAAEAQEGLEDTVGALRDSVCDCVIVKTEYLSQKGESENPQPDEARLEDIFSLAETLKKDKLSVYAQLDISLPAEFAAAVTENESIDGVVVSGAEGLSESEIQAELLSLCKAVKQNKKELIFSLPSDVDRISLNSSHADTVLASLDVESDSEYIADAFERLESKISGCNTSVTVCFNISKIGKKGLCARSLLEQVAAADGFSFVSARVFDSLAYAQKDYEGCFSAVEKYICEGVDLGRAFSDLSIDGYDGNTAETENYTVSLTVKGSPLYPAYLDGEQLMLDENGNAGVELSLQTGLNEFTFTQNKSSLTYKINVTFAGDLIKSVEPSESISGTPGKTSEVVIYAASEAEVTVRAGTEKFTAKAQKYESAGYKKYVAEVKMPESRLALESIGRLVVTASLGDQTVSLDGPTVVYAEEETTVEVTTLPASNFEAPREESESVTYVSAPSNTVAYTGNQMCIVTEDTADTWPAGTDSADFVPYYTPLVRGTMDYVVGQSEVYDTEEEEMRYFYELSCGRRVQQKSVSLIESYNMGDNSLQVLSCSGENGNLKITLSTKWKVPYSFSFAPQEYKAGYTKLYNVDSFTAQYIQFTFYHTAIATGSISTQGSDIVSSASWSVDPNAKTATLTLPLKSQGVYFGYSIDYDSSDNLVLTIHNNPQSLSGSVIVLDPGHGGSDPGATGFSGAVKESDINFAVAVAAMQQLQSKGATVYLTRYEDKKMTLEERKEFARAIKPDVFISIHANGSVNSSNIGTSAYYFRPMSKALSECVYNEVVSAYKNYIYPSSPEKQAQIARGCDFHPFSVTRLEDCPSMLLEVGYMTNDEECAKLADAAVREKIAEAICNGVEKFFSLN